MRALCVRSARCAKMPPSPRFMYHEHRNGAGMTSKGQRDPSRRLSPSVPLYSVYMPPPTLVLKETIKWIC